MGDAGFSDDLGGGAARRRADERRSSSCPGSTVTGRPTRRPLAVATARAWAAREGVGAFHLPEEGEQHRGELGHRIGRVARVDPDRVGQVGVLVRIVSPAPNHGDLVACQNRRRRAAGSWAAVIAATASPEGWT